MPPKFHTVSQKQSGPEQLEIVTTTTKHGTSHRLQKAKAEDDLLTPLKPVKKRDANAAGCTPPDSKTQPNPASSRARFDTPETSMPHYDGGSPADSSYSAPGYDQPNLDDAPHDPLWKPSLLERDPTSRTSEGKSTHKYMDHWIRESSVAYLYTILQAEGRGSSCSTCSAQVEYRCLDCIGSPRFCTGCCRIRHRHDPFHRIESWINDTWQPAWLWQVGTIICLGHGLEPCPSHGKSRDQLEQQVLTLTAAELPGVRAYADDPAFGAKPPAGTLGALPLMSITHTNGFHYIPLYDCACSNETKDIQLLKAGLYPATSANPRTVFSLQLLKHFHLMKVDSHMSVEQYCDILRRLTNYIFPNKTLDRKRELTRAWQQHNYITLLKRNGFGLTNMHDVSPGKGQLALFCPACPQVGINIPENWAELDHRWRFWRYLTTDGNFVLDHLEIVSPDSAVWLTNGTQYMAERVRFNQFIAQKSDPERDDSGSCNELRAIAEKNKAKRGYDSTGVVAIACARHGCFAPGSVVDMQKGERQVNVDFAVCESVETTKAALLAGLRLAYDVNCQYCVHFRERIGDKESLLSFPQDLEIIFLIGLFHVHGHVDQCLARFASTYLPGAGCASGEILESLWATLNGAAGTTRNMTLAYRSETLDACIADSNWKKLLSLVKWLVKQLDRAIEDGGMARQAFEGLDKSVTDEERPEWSLLMERANTARLKDPAAMDVYSSRFPKAMGRREVQIKLMRSAREEANGEIGVAGWIALGISIQEEQLELQAHIRNGPKNKAGGHALELERKRESIVKHANSYLKSGAELWPELALQEVTVRAIPDYEPCVCETEAECICAKLLTEFSTRERAAQTKNPGIVVPMPSTAVEVPEEWTNAAEIEEELRVAQVYEALDAIRGHIAHKSHLYRDKQDAASGVRPNRRSYDRISKVESSLRLEYPEFEEILKGHTKAIVSVFQPNAPNGSKIDLSWIWKVGLGVLESDDAYVRDLYRINWIRARSRYDRWREERIMVESEMEWFVRFAKNRHDRAAGWANNGLTGGHKAYGLRQAETWRRIGTFAKLEFEQKSKVKIDVVIG